MATLHFLFISLQSYILQISVVIQPGCMWRILSTCVCVYLIGPDEGLDGKVILHQLLHVGLSSDQRGELRSGRQTQRRLVGSTGRSAGISVPEKYIPRLEERRRRI